MDASDGALGLMWVVTGNRQLSSQDDMATLLSTVGVVDPWVNQLTHDQRKALCHTVRR